MNLPSDDRALWLGRYVLPHEPLLRAWLHRQQLGGLDVDDIIQEAYAALASARSVGHIAEPKNYFFQTCKSIILMHFRRSRVVSMGSLGRLEELSICPQPLPDRQVEDRQELHNLAVAIASLPPKCRRIFILRRVEGVSQREVALRLKVSENTVEKHMGKALGLLLDVFGRGGKPMAHASKSQEDWIPDVAPGKQLRD